jgi:hypothetical protein
MVVILYINGLKNNIFHPINEVLIRSSAQKRAHGNLKHWTISYVKK